MAFAFDIIRKPSELPNQEGFKFIGVLHDDKCVECHVVRDEKSGLYNVAGGASWKQLKGWKYLKQ